MTSWGIPVPVPLTFRPMYRRHRVAGVDGRVDQDLLDLARVGQHRAQPGR
jgi:hypothetical protein